MLKNLGKRYNDSFYRIYPWQYAIETDFLFFAVCDVMFLHAVKNISFAQISFLFFFALLFSIVIQYPLLKCIHALGTRRSVRLGSLVFLASALCITFAPNYGIVVVGGILKAVGHTFNTLGTALLKQKLVHDNRGEEYVGFQSDANNVACLLMMASSFACGLLYAQNPYYPMFGCIGACAVGVVLSFAITMHKGFAESEGVVEQEKKGGRTFLGIPLLVSFGIVTAITGMGLSYARINFQDVVSFRFDSAGTMEQLGFIMFLVFLFRMLSNILMAKFFARFWKWIFIGLHLLLVLALVMQILPWVYQPMTLMVVLVAIGYLMTAFVRDPYMTAVQNDSLLTADKDKQQENLIVLNVARKVGALLLSGGCTLMLREMSIMPVMVLMAAMAVLSFALVWFRKTR